MSEHSHNTLVDGCFRCDLNRDEMGIATHPRPERLEWPPPTISEWIGGGGVTTGALVAELRAWAAYFSEDS